MNLSGQRAVIFSGGPTHDFPASSARLAELLSADGWTTTITEDPDNLIERLDQSALLVTNTLRWTMRQPLRYVDRAEAFGFSPSPELRQALTGHLQQGGGLLAMHTATICFDDWPEWTQVLGAVWNWDRSFHPPVGRMRVHVSPRHHPLTEGLNDFDTSDEVYSELDIAADVEPLLTANSNGRSQPLAWVKQYGAGRVAHNALGHHVPSFEAPDHQELLRRLAHWAIAS